ncbi:MAG TPA: D-2-hydroxyacid dehydrogenase [Gemmatimonadaceae bacterium]|nr:D-2-hydroxyacid dehydrogenase [Gemmatimonadaceae bacterium]
MRLLVADVAARSKNWSLPPDGAERLRAATPPGWRIHIVKAPTSSDGDGPPRPSDEVMEAIREAEVYFGFGIPRDLFVEAKKLRWVHSAAAGVGSALHEEMRRSDVLLTNSAGIHAVPIAEYAVAGILHFLRGFDVALDQQRQAKWDKAFFVAEDAPLREMDTVRALIVGTGGLGGETGRRLAALGARVTGVRRRPELGPPPGFERVIPLSGIEAALPGHDVVVLAAPLTGETAGLMTAARLDLMPRNGILVNVARGALVDDEALVERLQSGRLRGAVLDVFREEPLAATSPLWHLRQILLTPHISPVSPGRFWPRQLDLFLGNWARYIRGETLVNVVDKAAGY